MFGNRHNDPNDPNEYMGCPDCGGAGCRTCGDGQVPTWLADPDITGEDCARAWGWDGRR